MFFLLRLHWYFLTYLFIWLLNLLLNFTDKFSFFLFFKHLIELGLRSLFSLILPLERLTCNLWSDLGCSLCRRHRIVECHCCYLWPLSPGWHLAFPSCTFLCREVAPQRSTSAQKFVCRLVFYLRHYFLALTLHWLHTVLILLCFIVEWVLTLWRRPSLHALRIWAVVADR